MSFLSKKGVFSLFSIIFFNIFTFLIFLIFSPNYSNSYKECVPAHFNPKKKPVLSFFFVKSCQNHDFCRFSTKCQSHDFGRFGRFGGCFKIQKKYIPPFLNILILSRAFRFRYVLVIFRDQNSENPSEKHFPKKLKKYRKNVEKTNCFIADS